MAKKGLGKGTRVNYIIYDEVANWPEDVVLSEQKKGTAMTDRYEIAWRIWCWREGYGKAEDREILVNWMRDAENMLTANDIAQRDDCLSIADDIISAYESAMVIAEEMIDRAARVLWEEACLPYIADVRHFTEEDIRNGELRRARDICEEKNRSLVRRALEAALNKEP